MPSRSPEQARFMRAVANNPEFAAEVGVPQSVGAEFMAKDKVKKYRNLGSVTNSPIRDRADVLGQGLGSMGAVEGATDVGLGARGARSRPRTPPMGFSPRSRLPTMGAPEGPFRRPGTPRDEVRDRPLGFTVEDVKPRKKRKKKKSAGGTIKSYYHGGKIRGCGKETQGRRKAKMVRMKGS